MGTTVEEQRRIRRRAQLQFVTRADLAEAISRMTALLEGEENPLRVMMIEELIEDYESALLQRAVDPEGEG